jgi:hypothetical protein
MKDGEVAVHIEWRLPLSGLHSIMMEKLAQPGMGGRCITCMPTPPLTLSIPLRTKLWCMLQLRGQIHSPGSTLSYMYSVVWGFVRVWATG